jgi:hypothetical protein
MVVFVDLEEEGRDLHSRDGNGDHMDINPVTPTARNQPCHETAEEDRENPNINGFSAALSCYP